MKVSSLSVVKLETRLCLYHLNTLRTMSSLLSGRNNIRAGRGESIELVVSSLYDRQRLKKVFSGLSWDEMAALWIASEISNPTVDRVYSLLTAQLGNRDDAGRAMQNVLRRGLLMISEDDYLPAVLVNEQLLNKDYDVILPGLTAEFVKEPARKRRIIDEVPHEDIVQVEENSILELYAKLAAIGRILSGKIYTVTVEGRVIKSQQKHLSAGLGNGPLYPALFVADVAVASGIARVDYPYMRRGGLSDSLLTMPLEESSKLLFERYMSKGIWADDMPPSEVPQPRGKGPRRYSHDEFIIPYEELLTARETIAACLSVLDNKGWISMERFVDSVLKSGILSVQNPLFYSGLFEVAFRREFVRCFIGLTCLRFGLVRIGSTRGGDPHEFGRPERFQGSGARVFSRRKAQASEEEKYYQRWTSDSGAAFQFTDLGRHIFLDEPLDSAGHQPSFTDGIVAGADFEVIAEKEGVSSMQMLKLLTFCEPLEGHHSDRVKRLKISRDSIFNALQCGESSSSICDFLSQISRAGMPQNVRQSIREWERQFGRITIFEGMDLLEFKNRVNRDSLLSSGGDLRSVGDLFLLSPCLKDTKGVTVIDYDKKPRRCLKLDGESCAIEVVSSEADLTVEHFLSRFAVRSRDNKNVYKVTKGSVSASALESIAINGGLTRLTIGNVPPDMALSISAWKGADIQAYLAKPSVLQVDNPQLLDTICARKSIRDCIAGVIRPVYLVVTKGKESEVISRLSQMGIKVDEGRMQVERLPATGRINLDPISSPGYEEEDDEWDEEDFEDEEDYDEVEGPDEGQFLRGGRKVGRNEPCPCGSGRKYKRCCVDRE